MLQTVRNHGWKMTILGLLALLLAACGTVQTPVQDGVVIPDEQVLLESDPNPPVAGEETKLKIQLEAGKLPEGTRIDLEVRKEGSARGRFLKTEIEGSQSYSAAETFEEAGTYRVFIHIYSAEIHQTLERKLDVS